ncbi:MAG TPA: cysteine synthase family protein [Gemmatimonadales bacterium]|nr:cysteine synthase family protein [Gemmatimonadales bacterium]
MTIALTPAARGSLLTDAGRRRYRDVRELIASPENPTPLVRLNRVLPPGIDGYLKLEWFNPFGSIKDRTARALLEGLRQRDELRGKELVEPTSGNTGIALAALAALEGLRLTVTIPSGVPEEKLVLLRMLGATVLPTPDELCPVDNPRDGAIALARAIAESPAHAGRYVMPNQYANPDNVRAHFETTGPEIWEQTEGQVRTFVAGYGTCGTITGVGRFLKQRDPSIRVVAVEPQRGHRLPGLKNLEEAKTPEILDRSVIDDVIRVDDDPAYAMALRLFREEALIVGPSTGAIAHAIALLDHADGPVVGISPDGGQKYASFYADLVGDSDAVEI